MTDSVDAKRERPWHPPGYRASGRGIERLEKFQDLVRHLDRFGADLNLARPISDLIPGAPIERSHDQVRLIEREINRLVPVVFHDLREVGIPTRIKVPNEVLEYDFEKGKQVRKDKTETFDRSGVRLLRTCEPRS
jgi:hypothetical protein